MNVTTRKTALDNGEKPMSIEKITDVFACVEKGPVL